MRATATETLPGGMLDFLIAAQGPLPGIEDLAAGRARAASEALTVSSPAPVMAAWRYAAEHAALLTLPDGGALPFQDPVDERPPWPHQPDLPPEASPEYRICWALCKLCVGMRDLRGMLPPLTSQEVSPAGQLWRWGTNVLQYGRTAIAPSWNGLGPHIDLLAADLAGRAGRRGEAEALLANARSGFGMTGDSRGAAASALVAGDWLAAPFASPVTWGFALCVGTAKDSELPASTEENEHGRPSDPAGAAAAYEEAGAMYRAAGDRRGEAVAAWRQAYLWHITGDAERATAQARSAARMLSAAGDDASALLAEAHAALAGLANGQVPAADVVAAPVIAWGTGQGSLSYAIGIGIMFARAGRHWMVADRRPELAIAACTIAEAVWAGLRRPVSRSQTLADQAHALSALGARHAALVHLTRAVDADSAPMRVPVDPMDVRRQRAVLLAADMFNLANKAADTQGMVRAQRLLRASCDPLREHLAEVPPQQALVASQMVALADTLGQRVIGLAYEAQRARERGDDAAAARLFAEAEQAVAQTSPPEEGQSMAFVRAFELRFAEAGAIYKPWLAARLHDMSAAQLSATSGGAAVLVRRAERNLRDESLLFFVRIGDAHAAREQLTVLQSQADPWWSELGTAWEHENAAGLLLEQEGDLDAAALTFERAVDAIEAVRAELRRDDLKQAFGAESTVQQVYRNAARVELRRREAAMTQARPGAAAADHGSAALRLLELGRSRALVDLMAAPVPGLPVALIDAWRGASAEVALGQDRLAAALAVDPADAAQVTVRTAELSAAQDRLAACESELRALNPGFWRIAAVSSVPPDPGGVLARLPEGHVVVMYSLDRPDYLACGFSSAGLVAAAWSQTERRISRITDELVTACAEGRPWQQPATDLAAILLEPVAAALDGASTVHVIASGMTLRVPFAVLPWRGRPLGEQVMLTALPSLSAYPLLTADDRAGHAVCVGNPAHMRYRRAPGDQPRLLPPLRAAGVEAGAVAAILGGTALIGPEATKARMRGELPGARVVHLATHGVIDSDSPLASAVLLADGEQLTVAELIGMRLDADLVVLSACQTGTGEAAGGDELLGLGRALLAAGARSAVVTLWPVRDISAALIMTRFHVLRSQGCTSARALRDAMAWLSALTADQARAAYEALRAGRPAAREEESRAGPDGAAPAAAGPAGTPYGHPLHWAPFVLIGR